MANGFSPNIYSGGTVVFDTSPTVDLVNQIVNRKRAQDEALEQYGQNQFKSLNPAGLRNVDIPFFTEKVNEAQKFWQQNRKAIANPRVDGGQAQSEFQSRMTDAHAYIQSGKNEAKEEADLLAWAQKNRDLLPENVITDIIPNIQRPISDPNRKKIDWRTIQLNAGPFDLPKWTGEVSKLVKPSETITLGPTDPKTFQQTVTTTSSLRPQDKETIKNIAINRYKSDRSAEKLVQDALQSPPDIERLNKIYMDNYGKPVQQPEDLFVAATLSGIQDNITKEKNQADWKARQDYLQNQRVTLLNKRLDAEKTGKPAADGWINEYIGVLKEQSLAGPPIQFKYKNGQVAEEYDIPMDATLAKMLQKGNIQPDYLRYNPKTEKFRPIYAEHYVDKSGKRTTEIVKDKSGQFQVDEQLSQPISEPQLVLSLGGRVTPTQRTVEMKKSLELQKGGSNKPFKIEGKPYTRKQLNDMGYDDDEIDQFIKSGVITQGK